jgi:hypothetical protein
MRRLIVILISLLVTVAALAGQTIAGSTQLVLRCTGDSILVIVGGEQQWIPLSILNSTDTSTTDNYVELILISGNDTLVVQPSDDLVTVHLVRPTDTVQWHLLFGDYCSRSRQKYMDKLKEYPSFGHTPLPAFNHFSYTSDLPTGLPEMRDRFKLDSIAGDDGELSRILNLLRWVHSSIKWDGQKDNPSGTVIEQMSLCINDGSTMNCGGIAVVFAQVCNAVGIPARAVTCLPYDTADVDCHGTDIVWSDSLGKWLYMDPTFEAYFMDDDSILLSTSDLRSRITNGDSLVLNADANTNGAPKNRDEYICYMSKNLFRFLSGQDGINVVLNPTGYENEKNGKVALFYKIHRDAYFTDNAGIFWAPPTTAKGH